MTRPRRSLHRLIPLSLCALSLTFSGAAAAQTAPPQTPVTPATSSDGPYTLPPQSFPARPLSPSPRGITPPREDRVPTDRSGRPIDLSPRWDEPEDRDWRVGPITVREAPGARESGCRWSLRSRRVNYRCRF